MLRNRRRVNRFGNIPVYKASGAYVTSKEVHAEFVKRGYFLCITWKTFGWSSSYESVVIREREHGYGYGSIGGQTK